MEYFCKTGAWDWTETQHDLYFARKFKQHNSSKNSIYKKLLHDKICVQNFIVDGLAFFCRCSHYMFRPTWPSSGVYDILLFIPEGICFAVFVAFVACCYIMQFLICVCFCCVSVNFHILVCVFGFLAFSCYWTILNNTVQQDAKI
jgi:hypothetical protein